MKPVYRFLSLATFVGGFALTSEEAQAQNTHHQQQIDCMASAIFYEAQGEPHKGKVAVANVILNRIRSGLYPKSVCGVIKQKGQFQWVHNTRLRKNRIYRPAVHRSHNKIQDLAAQIYRNHLNGGHADVTQGSLFFSSNGVRPAPRAIKSVKIGRHQFFTLASHGKKKVVRKSTPIKL